LSNQGDPVAKLPHAGKPDGKLDAGLSRQAAKAPKTHDILPGVQVLVHLDPTV
jgi:hypothetical protein